MKAVKLMQAVDDALYNNQDSSHRWHLGASVIGRKCAREIFYTHRWAKDRKVIPRMLRLFNRGHREEAQIIAWLRDAGITVIEGENGEQIRVMDSTGHFGGSLDCELAGVPDIPGGETAVGEFKTHNAKSFANICALGVQQHKPEHFTQMAIYMAARARRFAVYVAVNKDDDDLYIEIIEWGKDTQAAVTRANERANGILTDDTPPPRLSDDPSFWLCRFCDFHSICHGKETPAINCRTCAHAGVGEDGTWTCARFDHVFTKSLEERDGAEMYDGEPPRMADGCEAHVYNPHLLNGVEFLGGDAAENYTELRLSNGTIVRNGPTYTPSQHLCLSDPAPISKKPSTPSSATSTRRRARP